MYDLKAMVEHNSVISLVVSDASLIYVTA